MNERPALGVVSRTSKSVEVGREGERRERERSKERKTAVTVQVRVQGRGQQSGWFI